MREPLQSRYPQLETPSYETWEFFFAIAGVSVAVAGLMGRISDSTFGEVYEQAIHPALQDWASAADAALMDCSRRVESGLRDVPALEPVDAVGLWVFKGLRRTDALSRDDVNAVHALGVAATAAFGEWWDDCPEVRPRN
jgi:hypothetical protein